MPSSRRPGSTSRRRVAGQRNRTGSQGPGSRLGLNRPEASAEQDATPDSGAPGVGESGPENPGAATSGADEPAAAESGAGESAAGESGAAESGAEESGAGESGAGESGAGEYRAAEDVAERSDSERPTAAGEQAGSADVATLEAEPEPPTVEPELVATVPGGPAPTDDDPAPAPPAEESAAGERPADESAERGSGGRGATGLIAAVLAAAVVLAGLATWFGIEAYAARNGNQALADQAGTSEVNGQISQGVEQIFSYDFADTGKTERAAKDLLVGDAIGEYEQLFTTVKQQAPIQKLVVTTTVKASSVTRLEGDRAEVLLFVDQNATRTDVGGQPSVGPAQVVINAEKQGDRWKISRISQH